jgi:transcriptional regulator with GAF, ATPase, and Fis domain
MIATTAPTPRRANQTRPLSTELSPVASIRTGLTGDEIKQAFRDNLLRILQKTNWKIKGPDGAAELLGVKPTTLLSRMDRWGLKKPAA